MLAGTAGTTLSSLTEPYADSPAVNTNEGITAVKVITSDSSNKQSPRHNIRNERPRKLSFSTVELLAVRVIERNWWSYRDRQVFMLLKDAICKAEESLSIDIIRKVCPIEAELLKDKTVPVKIRFRFGGEEFPPIILFKIFVESKDLRVKYFNGKKLIKPASQAATDACRMMGYRKFYDQMIADAWDRDCNHVTGEVDVVTLQDYMKYQSNLDESPSYTGGKDNLWRRLTLENVPRHNIMYDVFSYMATGVASEMLISQMPYATNYYVPTSGLPLGSPVKDYSPWSRQTSTGASSRTFRSGKSESQRGSKRAQKRVAAMKMNYLTKHDLNNDTLENKASVNNEVTTITNAVLKENQNQQSAEAGDAIFEDDWEERAGDLYEWSKSLSYDELN